MDDPNRPKSRRHRQHGLGALQLYGGQRAKAIHDGAFVWADSQGSDFSSTAVNSFRVRGLNGAWFQANNSIYAGIVDNDGDGDGLRDYTAASRGNAWAAASINDFGTNPGLVAAAGVADALAGTVDPVLHVQQSGPAAPGVVGVVFSRAAVTPSEKDGEALDSIQAADGAIQPGDYLVIVVQGLAQVKVAKDEAVTPGQRLKASDTADQARGLRTVQVDGVTLDEGGAVIGVLLDAPDAASGLAPVMVTLR